MIRFPLLVLGISLTACATAYKPNSFWNDGGFTETEIQPGLFQVRFKGNEFTSGERTADLAMLRAADLCLAQGKPFMLLGEVATSFVQSALVPGSSTTTATANAYVSGNTVNAIGSSNTTITPPTALYSPQSGLTVACGSEQRDGAWDASFLSRSLKAKYKIAVD